MLQYLSASVHGNIISFAAAFIVAALLIWRLKKTSEKEWVSTNIDPLPTPKDPPSSEDVGEFVGGESIEADDAAPVSPPVPVTETPSRPLVDRVSWHHIRIDHGSGDVEDLKILGEVHKGFARVRRFGDGQAPITRRLVEV